MLPFIQAQDIDAVALVCADMFKFGMDAEVLEKTWSILGKLACNPGACPSLLGVSRPAPNAVHGGDALCCRMLPRPSADGRESILQQTFAFIRGCERNVMVNCPAMLTMLNFETS